ncbi:4-galactosyl-N-acetylglucosaminide 3-alpha-L-fucosyltransferase 9-like isoform X1 [Neoarius graeffei]|uniref:4-galactosyl-N-acetylglucosaminide 3-alpha-L-fucosyltransferase 9-like isoform X1 n=2 Tax=Neoarius graeffei TaxID=443677 RepID=UPI00298D30F8|nr:4-galactosyl-N-acetylglucosaminide 3-alpha-L-fucosyltransferase 9-like isoform X1 [Neoarius graeffei]
MESARRLQGSGMMLTMSKLQQLSLIAICWLGGILSCLLFFQYTSPTCPSQHFPPYQPNVYKNIDFSNLTFATDSQTQEKPILLLWFWPENYRWDFGDCKTIYNIDGCHLTDDRTLYNQADAVLIFHKAIKWDLSNLPPSPRPPFQKWIWFHVESPTNTPKVPGLENLFNLTLSYRRDADISVRYRLTVNKKPNEDFVIPKKDKLLCWFVSNLVPSTGVGTRMNYYNELKKYITVHLFGKITGARMKDEDYYSTMASCKFYLAFENSIHKDYFTEKLNGPLTVGTVPVVLGPPRQNYEDFAPANSFIHVNDFPNAEALAKYLHQLDKDDEAYKRYFDWRKHLTATPHLIHWNQEFVIYICHACEYIGRHKEYKAVHDIYKWWFS